MNKTNEPIALLDMDGTVADFDSSMRTYLSAIAGPDENPVHWETEYEDLPYMKARRRLIKSIPGFWANLTTLPLGFDVVDILKELEYHIHVLTKCPKVNKLPDGRDAEPNAYSEKAQWCFKHLPDVPITMSHDKGLVYGSVLVDDWPPYIERWLEWRPRGLVVAIAQPWNIGIDKKFDRVIRYSSSNRDELVDRLTKQRRRSPGRPADE